MVAAGIYNGQELEAIGRVVEGMQESGPNYLRSGALFAVRQFLNEVPQIGPLLFNPGLLRLIEREIGQAQFVVRAVYFDKPPGSDWAVPWHQDMTISVRERKEIAGFHGWTRKEGQYSVCPPAVYMDAVSTIRIHLDDTDETNGALRVLPASHRNGVVRTTEMQIVADDVVTVCVPRGGVMLMKPLIYHASDRSRSQKARRVIHIEVSAMELPHGMEWSERQQIPDMPPL